MTLAEPMEPEDRDLHEVLDNFDYYETMRATIWLHFEDRADVSFQLGEQVGPDQVRKRDTDNAIKVDLGDARLALYDHEQTGRRTVAWTQNGDVRGPERTRVTLGVDQP